VRRAKAPPPTQDKDHELPPGQSSQWGGPESGFFSYFDDWRSAITECPHCGWRGTLVDGWVQTVERLLIITCPRCASSPCLALVSPPTIKELEVEGNLDKLPPEEREESRAWVDFNRRWEAGSLKSPSQLPQLRGDKLRLIWDFEEVDGEFYTVIRKGRSEVWRELAFYGAADRFTEVAGIMKARYGDQIVDLEPSSMSKMYLYGDSLSTIKLVDDARRLLREP
jgi:hypothetical protein